MNAPRFEISSGRLFSNAVAVASGTPAAASQIREIQSRQGDQKMKRKRCVLLWTGGLMLMAILSISGQEKSPLKLIQKIPMQGVKGRLDHFGVDLEGNRLFVAAL